MSLSFDILLNVPHAFSIFIILSVETLLKATVHYIKKSRTLNHLGLTKRL